MTVLLDGNVLVALFVSDHVHHDAAEQWLAGSDERFATCPITQGSLARLLVREGQHGAAVEALLAGLTEHPRHEFWEDGLSYSQVPLRGIVGHRQVTDAYLAQLARSHQARLASFNGGLAALNPDVVEVVPQIPPGTSGRSERRR